jgi:hypothetical protein
LDWTSNSFRINNQRITIEGSSISSVISGSEELLVGDVTTDTFLSAAGYSVGIGEVADSIFVAAGEAGGAVLSFVPSWMLSGGMAALVSELIFAMFSVFIVLKSGSSVASVAVSNVMDAKDAEEELRLEVKHWKRTLTSKRQK